MFVNKRLKREIRRYLGALPALPDPSAPLFRTQKNGAFSANTLCQLFGDLYRKAGKVGSRGYAGCHTTFRRLYPQVRTLRMAVVLVRA